MKSKKQQFICKYGCLQKDEANCFVKCEDRNICTLDSNESLYKTQSFEKPLSPYLQICTGCGIKQKNVKDKL